MPFNFQQINPVDLNPNVGVGVNLPFSGPSVFTSNYLTSQAIKNNLINFFLTNPGEIPLNPTFGGGLRAFIFEQMSEGTLTGIENSINYSLETFFPNIGFQYKANAGDLLIFPGAGKEYDHGVRPVSSGPIRYIVTGFGYDQKVELLKTMQYVFEDPETGKLLNKD
jgi:hypothetical protein